MTTNNVEYSIKELFDKLDSRFDKIDKRFDKVDERFEKLETKIDGISENVAELKTEVKVLDEKLIGINSRLDTQEFINRGVVLGLLLAVLGGFAKLFGFGQ